MSKQIPVVCSELFPSWSFSSITQVFPSQALLWGFSMAVTDVAKNRYHVTSDLEGQFCKLFERLRSGKPEVVKGREENVLQWLAFVQNAGLFRAMVIKTGVSDEDLGGGGLGGWSFKNSLDLQAMWTNRIVKEKRVDSGHSKVRRK